MNDVDDAFWLAVLVVSVSPWRSDITSALLLDVIPEVPLLDEVLQVGFVAPALVGSCPFCLWYAQNLLWSREEGSVVIDRGYLKKGCAFILLRSL